MGYWTYTYADIKQKRATDESMGYDGAKPIYLACPDGTFIKEDFYDGYGHIGGHDMHELVADWNRNTPEAVALMQAKLTEDIAERDELLKTLSKQEQKHSTRLYWLNGEIPRFQVAVAWLSGEIEELPENFEKRDIGIEIDTYEEDAEQIRYPLKFVKNTKYTYDQIKGYSANTQ